MKITTDNLKNHSVIPNLAHEEHLVCEDCGKEFDTSLPDWRLSLEMSICSPNKLGIKQSRSIDYKLNHNNVFSYVTRN